MDFVFLGRQGSGKGTQIRRFTDAHSEYHVFEMGAAFRAFFKTDNPKAKELKEKADQGYLLSDEDVMSVFTDAMSQYDAVPERMIYDGIPRRVGQQQMFNEWMREQQRDFRVVNIIISQEEAIERLTKRRVCEGCGRNFLPDYAEEQCSACGGTLVTREDDQDIAAIKKRLNEFEENTVPVLEQYEAAGMLIDINGEQTPGAVEAEIRAKLESFI